MISTNPPTKQEIQEVIQQIETLAVNLFGRDKVKSTPAESYWGFDITIRPEKTSDRNAYQPKNIVLSFDARDFYMTIDDYRWEFDDKLANAEEEISNYLKAFSANKVVQKQVRLMGITLSSKLEIIP